MGKGTYATFTMRDARGKVTQRRYQARDAAVTDAQVVDLATDLQALTKLSVVEATVSRAVDISAVTAAPVAGCSVNDKFNLRYEKSLLRNSHGGVYTFSVPELQDALVNSNGTIITTANEFDAWRENFDDGAGLAAVVGDFYVSDGEELVEDAEILGGEIVG
jgi:hypothetical protein